MKTYSKLLPTNEPPFPFPQGPNGEFPFDPLPDGVLSPSIPMQDYYIAALAEAQKIDAGAVISNDSGLAIITMPDGRDVKLTNVGQNEVASGRQTVGQQVWRALGIPEPTAPPQPTPAAKSDAWRNAKPGTKVQIDGEWFIVVRLGIFGNSIAPTDPPAVQPAAKTIPVDSIVEFVRGKLLTAKEPAAKDAWVSLADWLTEEVSK